jgi:hypothetical protein
VTEPVTVRFCAAAPAAKAIVAASVITIFLIITNDLIFQFSDVGCRHPKKSAKFCLFDDETALVSLCG